MSSLVLEEVRAEPKGRGPRGRGSSCHVTSFDCLQEARAERSASVSQALGSVSVSLPVRGRA